MKAAYDLRSLYVHTGIDFGHWTHPHGAILNEVQLGRPIVRENERFEQAVGPAPTYFGLERIMRYCLLCFIYLHGVKIDDRLGGPPPSPNAAHEEENDEEENEKTAGSEKRPSAKRDSGEVTQSATGSAEKQSAGDDQAHG